MKTCSKCKRQLDESEFYWRLLSGTRKPTNPCKRCVIASAKEWLDSHLDQRRAINRKYGARNAGRIREKRLARHNSMTNKSCSKCRKLLHPSCFSFYDSQCKTCKARAARERRLAQSTDVKRSNNRRYYEKAKTVTGYMEKAVVRSTRRRSKIREALTDEYVRGLLSSHRIGIPSKLITQSLIEAKRMHLKLHRLLKEKMK